MDLGGEEDLYAKICLVWCQTWFLLFDSANHNRVSSNFLVSSQYETCKIYADLCSTFAFAVVSV